MSDQSKNVVHNHLHQNQYGHPQPAICRVHEESILVKQHLEFLKHELNSQKDRILFLENLVNQLQSEKQHLANELINVKAKSYARRRKAA